MLSVAIATAYGGVAEVVATDLPSVVPLLRRNVARLPASRKARAAELSWGCELDAALARPDVVLCCELAYWGGWSLLEDDTRLPLRRTLRALGGAVFFACTLRDADRELGFVHALQAEDGWVCRCVRICSRRLHEAADAAGQPASHRAAQLWRARRKATCCFSCSHAPNTRVNRRVLDVCPMMP